MALIKQGNIFSLLQGQLNQELYFSVIRISTWQQLTLKQTHKLCKTDLENCQGIHINVVKLVQEITSVLLHSPHLVSIYYYTRLLKFPLQGSSRYFSGCTALLHYHSEKTATQ